MTLAVGGDGHLFEGWATDHITTGNWLDHGTQLGAGQTFVGPDQITVVHSEVD